MISVIICTYNGQLRIESVLKSLKNQTFQDFEVIVVDDGSTDSTSQYLKSVDWSLPKLKIISQSNLGRSGAKNSGIRNSSGDLLVFFDDDVIVPDTCLSLYHEIFTNRDVNVVAGRQRSVEPDIKTPYIDYCNYLTAKWNMPNKNVDQRRPYISAANFAIRKEVILSINGFDNRLNDFEDFDLAVRLVDKGFIIKNVDVLVGHPMRTSVFEHVNRFKNYELNRRKLLDINPLTRKYFDEVKQSYFKRVIYRVLSRKIFLSAIDRDCFFFIPKKYRYRLYDAIITSHLFI